MGQPVQLHQPAGCRFDYRGGDDHPDWCGRGRLSGTVDNPAWGIDLNRMPVVRSIYGAIKRILETVISTQSDAFREVILLNIRAVDYG